MRYLGVVFLFIISQELFAQKRPINISNEKVDSYLEDSLLLQVKTNNSSNHYLEVDSIVVSYLDWKVRTRGRLSCEDVKNYNNGRNARYVISDKVVIQKFVRALSLVHMNLTMKKEEGDIRMVLDFYKSGELKKEICLNYIRGVLIDGNLYMSLPLYFLIDEEIPRTTAPF
ncbi:hypothetical protein [Acidiluteibacter ferrifornacis]|uniref:Uncharacterized protein n=1 Tax=Acidiluteibacter ferrifornacis TaxID=2692424 RepID=A0A6N9NIW0_9FLAO|nr:hypothetical protein [Acidiluteibacter ferrifornacis]NBG66616.1 hypothetical protein [Acidiluteibacter ferrifornacis]